MSNPTPQLEVLCSTCFAHISGPANQPAVFVSHGICQDCLRRDHPGAWKFGRRRALEERLALTADTTEQGIADLNAAWFNRGR